LHDPGASVGKKHGSEGDGRLAGALRKKLIHNRLHLRMIRRQARGQGDKDDQFLTVCELDRFVDVDVDQRHTPRNDVHSLRNDGFEKNRIFPHIRRQSQIFGSDPIVDDGLHRLQLGCRIDFWVKPIHSLEPELLTLWGGEDFPTCATKALRLGASAAKSPSAKAFASFGSSTQGPW
jgi:hypothetical protein